MLIILLVFIIKLQFIFANDQLDLLLSHFLFIIHEKHSNKCLTFFL